VPPLDESSIFTVKTALIQVAHTVDDPRSQNCDGSCPNAIWMSGAVLPSGVDKVNQSIDASLLIRPNVPVPVVELPNRATQTLPSGPETVPTGVMPNLTAGVQPSENVTTCRVDGDKYRTAAHCPDLVIIRVVGVNSHYVGTVFACYPQIAIVFKHAMRPKCRRRYGDGIDNAWLCVDVVTIWIDLQNSVIKLNSCPDGGSGYVSSGPRLKC
jgi:hypothetical protein